MNNGTGKLIVEHKKILWVCNVRPGKISSLLGVRANCLGGWLDSTCKILSEFDNIEMTVLFPDEYEFQGSSGNFSYYSFKEKYCNARFESVIKRIVPDIIHIWGTEYPHSNEALKVCDKLGMINRCVVSIQGLVSLHGKRHYIEGLPNRIVRRFTLRDFIKQDNIQKGRENFLKCGKSEIEALQRTKHIIGRTDWDRAASQMFNPQAEYHFCNETLRESFYKGRWDIKKIERHSIFVSQCSYPLKGFHYMLEAMPEILRKHPDAMLYTTGKNLLNLSLRDSILITSYQKYLLTLIKQYHLKDHVCFLGTLSEEEMCGRYLKTNVFVSPSTIENSSNSVGEAMLLGCPVVSSDVGGVKNMLEHGQEGYIYQSSAPYMLAFYVNKIFENDELAREFSNNSRKHAAVTHNREVNMRTLCEIYENVMEYCSERQEDIHLKIETSGYSCFTELLP